MTKRILIAALIMMSISSYLWAAMAKDPYLIYTGNTDEMMVLWQLDATATCALEWGLDTSYSSGSVQTSEFGTDHQHEYVISGLAESTKYYYRVVAQGSNYPGSFVTAPPATATNLKLFAFGDTRSGWDVMDDVFATMLATYTSDPAYQTICLLSGDFTNTNSEGSWSGEYFNANASNAIDFRANVPVAGCRGNHEGPGTIFQKYYPYPYVNNFYWSFDYGPIHVTVVDQYAPYTTGTAQHDWIANDLATTTKPWKFVMFHSPAWSAYGWHANNTTAQAHLQPLFTANDVSLVIAGDNHYYARCDVDGVQHITTGGGGAPLYSPQNGQPYVVSSKRAYHHCEIDIQGDTLTFTSYNNARGTVIDTFSLVKASNPDTTPPTPDPMTFATVPYATGDSTIAMTASIATDTENGVEYYFTNTAGGGNDSGWQAGTFYEDSGLLPETQYTYTVTARDTSSNQNATAASAPASATTDPYVGCTPADMHIAAVSCAEVGGCSQGMKKGQVTVTINDDCGDPVVGALVDVTFSGDYSESFTDVATNGSGQVTITTSACFKKPSFTATVTDVTGTLPYDSNDDVTNSCNG